MNGAISNEILDAQELLQQVWQAPSMTGLNLTQLSNHLKEL